MLKLTANCNYFVGFASVGATSMQENRTPVPSFLLPKINWKKESLLSKEVYATFLLWKEPLMCRTNLGTVLCNLLHQTKKHDFDKFTLTSNEITGCRQNLEIIWNVYMQEPVNLGNTVTRTLPLNQEHIASEKRRQAISGSGTYHTKNTRVRSFFKYNQQRKSEHGTLRTDKASFT
jgi:hypothetical protein